MKWFGKKDKQPEKKMEPTAITFNAGDTPFQRAEKIWWALGFVNDRMGAIPQIAGILSMYRDWDREAIERDHEAD